MVVGRGAGGGGGGLGGDGGLTTGATGFTVTSTIGVSYNRNFI